MPISRTWKQDRKIEMYEIHKRMRRDNLIAIAKVTGIAVGCITFGIGLIYLTSLIPHIVDSFMGTSQ